MKTIYLSVLVTTSLFFVSCASISKLKENRALLKEYAFCKCLEYATKDSAFFKKDLSRAIYMEIASYYYDAYDTIDSLSKKAASEIMPSQIADHNGEKAILLDCFIFYKSKVLDSLVKSLDKKNYKGW